MAQLPVNLSLSVTIMHVKRIDGTLSSVVYGTTSSKSSLSVTIMHVKRIYETLSV